MAPDAPTASVFGLLNTNVVVLARKPDTKYSAVNLALPSVCSIR